MASFGIPREVRDMEARVGLSTAGVLDLTRAGHTVYVESGAGLGAGFKDDSYREAGAQVVYSAAELYGRSDIIAKVTRPAAAEHCHFREGQTIFSFLHLTLASPDLLKALQERAITAIAYEMIQDADGRRPVLWPASEVAGRMAPIIAGQLLRSDQTWPEQGGLGILLSGIPGVPPAVVVIVGGGALGTNAARAFLGVGAEVTVLDKDGRALQRVDEMLNGQVTTMFASEFNLKRAVHFADVLVGAAGVSGRRAPVLVTQEMVRRMRPGAVIIDFAIDQGGCVATSRPTTLRDPVYVREGVIHFSVPYITAAYARTTSYAITNAALPFLLAASAGNLDTAVAQEPALAKGINLVDGKLAHPEIAAALGRDLAFDLEQLGARS